VLFSEGACSERNAIANLAGSARNWAPDLESRIKVQPGRASGTPLQIIVSDTTVHVAGLPE